MAQMLGDNVLPESIQSRRRRLRNRLSELREPIRSRRQNLPGPNLIDRAEARLAEVRTTVVNREGVLQGIRDRMSDGSGSSDSNGSSNGSSSSSTQELM